MRKITAIKLAACAVALAPLAAQAVPVFSNAAVVTSASNSATFSSINYSGVDLSNYQEDGIRVTTPDTSWVNFSPFQNGTVTGFHYGNGGNDSWVTISMADGGVINAADFLLGDGWGGATTNLIWETFLGSTATGFGDVILNRGTTVGWVDTDGFTSLRVAANTSNIDSFGQYQAIAIDDLRVGAATAVPEPASLALLGIGVAGMGFSRRKKKA